MAPKQPRLEFSGPYRVMTSTKIYLMLVVIMIVLAGLQAILPLAINQGQQMSWLTVIIAAILGGIGLVLSPKAGFPSLWAADISSQQRFWQPFLGGGWLGVIMVVFDLNSPLGIEIHTKFPDSVIVFSLAGLVEEIIIHLFLTTLLIWVISGLILKQRYQEQIFWVVAIGISGLYWLLQISAIQSYFPEKYSVMLAVEILFVIGSTITAGAYVFRRWGFLAAISLRYGFYLIWHIIWGGGVGLVRYFM
ncbi:MAG: hypothetical protein BroJett011_67680 [Chloroflexota bacterium]|nr:MAG: hypothetical protein BroJett011_67680 [Chloroflexota bacterium]